MSLVTQIQSLATRVGVAIKSVTDKIGTLASLTTTDKTSLVDAINEVDAKIGAAQGETDLSVSTAASAVTIASSTGDNATIPAATTSAAGVFTSADKQKLNGIDAGATANSTDSQLRDRSTHTGAQPTSTITGLDSALAGTIPLTQKGANNGVASLDGGGKVPVAQLPDAVVGGVQYQGAWNASTNSPSLTSGTGTKGFYYKVDTAGPTNLDGITDWKVGDWAVFNGSVWEKIDNTESVTSVNGQLGAVSGLLEADSNFSDLNNVVTARTNLGVFSTTEVGPVTTNFVTTFEAEL